MRCFLVRIDFIIRPFLKLGRNWLFESTACRVLTLSHRRTSHDLWLQLRFRICSRITNFRKHFTFVYIHVCCTFSWDLVFVIFIFLTVRVRRWRLSRKVVNHSNLLWLTENTFFILSFWSYLLSIYGLSFALWLRSLNSSLRNAYRIVIRNGLTRGMQYISSLSSVKCRSPRNC